jgi:hypothetical protein
MLLRPRTDPRPSDRSTAAQDKENARLGQCPFDASEPITTGADALGIGRYKDLRQSKKILGDCGLEGGGEVCLFRNVTDKNDRFVHRSEIRGLMRIVSNCSALSIPAWAVNIDRPAGSCRSCVGNYERSRVHRCSASLHVHRATLKERPSVPCAKVLHGFNSGRGSAPKDVRFPNDIGQILFARDTKDSIANGCRKLSAGASANDVRALLHVCAAGERSGKQ